MFPPIPSSHPGKLHTINIEASGAAGSVLVLEEQTVPGEDGEDGEGVVHEIWGQQWG